MNKDDEKIESHISLEDRLLLMIKATEKIDAQLGELYDDFVVSFLLHFVSSYDHLILKRKGGGGGGGGGGLHRAGFIPIKYHPMFFAGKFLSHF